MHLEIGLSISAAGVIISLSTICRPPMLVSTSLNPCDSPALTKLNSKECKMYSHFLWVVAAGGEGEGGGGGGGGGGEAIFLGMKLKLSMRQLASPPPPPPPSKQSETLRQCGRLGSWKGQGAVWTGISLQWCKFLGEARIHLKRLCFLAATPPRRKKA